MKCPICKTELNVTHTAYESPYEVERTEECPHKHYGYEFMWGHTTVWIGKKEFHHYYSDTPVVKTLWEINIKRAILDFIVDNKEDLVEILI